MHYPARTRFGCHWITVCIHLTPVSCEIGVHPTIKLPRLIGVYGYAFVPGRQQISSDPFHCLGMASLVCLREASAPMESDGDVRPGGLLQEVQFANYTAVMELWLHVRPVGVLMQQCGGHRLRRLLCLESGCKCKSLRMESMRCGCDR